MMSIAKLAISLGSLIILILPVLALKGLNVKKSVRHKQIRYPFAAVIYLILCVIFSAKIESLIMKLTDNEYVKKFLDFISPSGKLDYSVVIYLAIAANVIIFFGFVIVKLVLKVGINSKKLPEDFDSLKGPKKLIWFIIGQFYDINPKKACPLRKWVGIQNALKYAAWILSGAYLLLALFVQLPVFAKWDWIPYDFLNNCVRALYILPAISLIAVNEFRWYLDGKEEFPKYGQTGFSRSSTESVSDYEELKEQYRQQFPERFVKCIEGRSAGKVTNYYNDAAVESDLERAILDQLRQKGITVSPDYLSCIRKLQNGENVLFDASLFSEVGEYLFTYFNTVLANGENILFVCADDEEAENLNRYISEKFREINNYSPVWLARSTDELHGSKDADILVVTPRIVFDKNVFIAQSKFFDRLTAVVLSDVAEIAVKDSAALNVLANKLGAGRDKLNYICLSESVPSGTVSSLKHILGLESEIYMCGGYQSFDNTHILLWNYESSSGVPAQDNLFGENASQTYFGVELPLACVGLKYMAEKISVIPGTGTPYMQIANSFKNQLVRYENYFNSQIGSQTFDGKINFKGIGSGAGQASFIIAADSLNNLPLAIYNYARFGGSDTTMIHIVSKPYMLRDYFAANAEAYLNGEAKINMIVPAFSDTKQTVLTRVLCDASEGGMDIDKLFEDVRTVYPDVGGVDEALKLCLKVLCPDDKNARIEDHFAFDDRYIYDAAQTDYKKRTFVKLKSEASLRRIMGDSERAVMVLRGKKFSLSFPARNIAQNILPSQSFVYNGSLYNAVSLDIENGAVNAMEASDRLDAPVDYIQVRTFEILSELKVEEIYPVVFESSESRMSKGYEAVLYTDSEVSADTLGYYSLSPVSPTLDLLNGPSYKPLSDRDRQAVRREYKNADIISFRIKGVGADRSDCTAFLLAVMMNELFKTVFPYSYKCLAACPVLSDRSAIYEDAMGGRIKNAYPQIADSAFIEHSPDDVEILIIEDSECEIGAIRSILKESQYPFSMFLNAIGSYLKWFSEFDDKDNMSKKYLYFGSDSLPECFDAETLLKLCEEFETMKRGNAIRVDLVTSKGRCSYCHRDLFNVSYTEVKDNAGANNRKLCEHCAKLIVRDENELADLYNTVRKDLCGYYGISLSEDITVKFATAEAIRKKLHTGDQRVVVGFADRNSRELWVEADAPRANVMDVLAHELTHFWQFDNIDCRSLEYLEGHASYVEVQYMRSEHRDAYADWQEAEFNARDDEYGEGFRRLVSELSERSDNNPFGYMSELFGK